MANRWSFASVTPGERPIRLDLYTEEFVRNWVAGKIMRDSSELLIDLPHLKIICDINENHLYLWWKD